MPQLWLRAACANTPVRYERSISTIDSLVRWFLRKHDVESADECLVKYRITQVIMSISTICLH